MEIESCKVMNKYVLNFKIKEGFNKLMEQIRPIIMFV